MIILVSCIICALLVPFWLLMFICRSPSQAYSLYNNASLPYYDKSLDLSSEDVDYLRSSLNESKNELKRLEPFIKAVVGKRYLLLLAFIASHGAIAVVDGPIFWLLGAEGVSLVVSAVSYCIWNKVRYIPLCDCEPGLSDEECSDWTSAGEYVQRIVYYVRFYRDWFDKSISYLGAMIFLIIMYLFCVGMLELVFIKSI